MKIIKAGYKILSEISEGGIRELQMIENVGRVCYKSEDRITPDGESAKKFVADLIKRGHEAMLEHSSLSVLFTVDRGVSHEQVRHRIASFAQESTRYCNYSKGKFGSEINVIDLEPGIRNDPGMQNLLEVDIAAIMTEWLSAMEDAERHYLKMLELGATPQIARSVLPQSTKTEITITANYREWRHFFKLRAVGTTGRPHPQMEEVAEPLLYEVSTLCLTVLKLVILLPYCSLNLIFLYLRG